MSEPERKDDATQASSTTEPDQSAPEVDQPSPEAGQASPDGQSDPVLAGKPAARRRALVAALACVVALAVAAGVWATGAFGGSAALTTVAQDDASSEASDSATSEADSSKDDASKKADKSKKGSSKKDSSKKKTSSAADKTTSADKSASSSSTSKSTATDAAEPSEAPQDAADTTADGEAAALEEQTNASEQDLALQDDPVEVEELPADEVVLSDDSTSVIDITGTDSASDAAPASDPEPTELMVSVVVDGTPAGGRRLDATVTLSIGANVYDALVATGASVNARSTTYGTYVAAIDGLAEKEHGSMSGWVYAVNGVEPNTACSNYVLSDGDSVVWTYVNVED